MAVKTKKVTGKLPEEAGYFSAAALKAAGKWLHKRIPRHRLEEYFDVKKEDGTLEE